MSAHIERDRPSLARKITIGVFLAGCGIAGVGFCFKIHEFLSDALDDEGIGFAGAHLLVYALVAGGFLMLLAHAFMRGHLADIEKPKYDLIEKEEAYDRDAYGTGS